MSKKLKACPFCGNTQILERQDENKSYVLCGAKDCGALIAEQAKNSTLEQEDLHD